VTSLPEPLDLIIHEPIGELALRLEGDKLIVSPSKAFSHALAERLARVESATRERAPVLDRWAARGRMTSAPRFQHFFGEFDISECEVDLRDSRLYLRAGRVRTHFGPQTFDLKQAEGFVRQFSRAKAGGR